MDRKIHGFININKPKNVTSFSVIGSLKKYLKPNKIGFAGTLDPIATGVLPVCIGFATRLENESISQSKEYVATGLFGQSTDSFDSEGLVTSTNSYNHISQRLIENYLGSLGSDLKQEAPIYSALKQNGVPMYKLARAGKSVEPKVRIVKLYSISLIRLDLPKFIIKITCGKGFYVRSLINDIGLALNSSAHMIDLERSRSGIFDLKSSFTILEAQRYLIEENLDKILCPPQSVLADYKKIVLTEDMQKSLLHGNNIKLQDNLANNGDKLFFINLNRVLIGTGIFIDGFGVPKKIIPNEQN